jgi:hypothetical protein
LLDVALRYTLHSCSKSYGRHTVAAVVLCGVREVLLWYGDEAGSGELLDPARPSSTPVLVIGGVIVPEEAATEVVQRYIRLKKKFNPQIAKMQLSDRIRTEVKGNTLLADIRGSNKKRRYALRFLAEVLDLLLELDCKIIARVTVKREGEVVNETALYAFSVQKHAEYFDHYARSKGMRGLMVLDSRTKTKNVGNVHSITTKRFGASGNSLPCLIEAPVFGHSDSHVILQIADLVSSAVLFPMGCRTYASDLTWNTHSHASYEHVRQQLGERVKKLQYRYQNDDGKWCGGIVVSDGRHKRSSGDMFPKPSPLAIQGLSIIGFIKS